VKFGPLLCDQQPSLVGRQRKDLSSEPTRKVYAVDSLGQFPHQSHSYVSHTPRLADMDDVDTFRCRAAASSIRQQVAHQLPKIDIDCQN
jgi:hypothetical protein